jgi:hypothetical protein
MKNTGKQSAESNAKDVVLSFIEALNNEDFKTARKYISDDMTFRGVMGNRDGGDTYIKDMGSMKLKYDLKKTIADKNDVVVFYDFTQSGTTLPGCGWYHTEGDKIDSLKVMFDPRPLLEAADKK